MHYGWPLTISLRKNISWESIVLGCKNLGSTNQMVSLIAYMIYKKCVQDRNSEIIDHRSVTTFVKQQLELRKNVYQYCPTKGSIVIEIANILSHL
jgi:hypothetical protein